jgi:hypothetical protein
LSPQTCCRGRQKPRQSRACEQWLYRNRFFEPLELGTRDASIVKRIRLVRIDFERLRNQPLTFGKLTALHKNNPEKMDGIEIAGIELENLEIARSASANWPR